MINRRSRVVLLSAAGGVAVVWLTMRATPLPVVEHPDFGTVAVPGPPVLDRSFVPATPVINPAPVDSALPWMSGTTSPEPRVPSARITFVEPVPARPVEQPMFDRAVVERAVFDPAQVSGQIAPVVYQPLSGPVPETSRVPAALSGGIEVLPYAR